ncbi:hypothetical protein OSSY52_07730 [Tepiditoga spiralis]|uniref:Flagellar hook-associated protein 2 n=1 Tax=Tepiditoga spiralis TaxID=2108365 RepID=A0A7G1G973_9BACT|nr:flagellar filament capping protein FliD [Tepiditoga spiralis]BBE30632.1 hypothetical protein OSSY52_07730 [Tepiditoga spiralis]
MSDSNSYMGMFQIGGLASGIDTKSIVEKLMEIETQPLKKVQTNFDELKYKQKSWTEINDKLQGFWDYMTTFSFQKNLIPKKAESADTDKVEATALSTSSNIDFYVKTTQLASSSYIKGTADSAITTASTLSDLSALDGDTLTFTVDGNAVTLNIKDDGTGDLKTTDTIQTLTDVINSKTDSNMIFEDGQVFVLNKNTGDKSLQIDSSNANILDKLFSTGTATTLTDVANGVTGSNANVEISFDGSTTHMTLTESSNNFNFNNVTLNIKSVDTSFTKISVSQDIDKSVEKIKEFVDKYNDVMNFLYDKLNENKVTDKAESDMTDEDKMKGLLKGDSNLENLFYKIKNIGYSQLNLVNNTNDYTSLYSIGVSSGDLEGNYSNTEKGLLSVDEEKLKEALNNNAHDVWNLFALNDLNNEEYGIGTQLKNYLWDTTKFGGYIDQISGTTGTIGVQMRSLAKEMVTMLDNVHKKEAYYNMKFSAMEQAINNMNSQGSYISQAFSK